MRGIVLCLYLLLAPGIVLAQATPARVDGPGVRVGDTWIYNKIDGWNGRLDDVSVNTVRRSDGRGIEMSSSSLDGKLVSKVMRTRDFNLVGVDGPGFAQRAKPFYPNYAFPLHVGKTWKRSVELLGTRQPGTSISAELEARVVGWEMVTVPAGNFLALKIEMSGWYDGKSIDWDWKGRIEDTLWYSPEVRNAVRYEYKELLGSSQVYGHEIHELVRFWPGK